VIEPLPVGWNEYLIREGRRILHSNSHVYVSMDMNPLAICFVVGGREVMRYTSPIPKLYPNIPSSVQGVSEVIRRPVGWDEILFKDGRYVVHLDAGTYISFDPTGIRIYVAGTCVANYPCQAPSSFTIPKLDPNVGINLSNTSGIGYEEYLYQAGRRIVHSNPWTYMSLDPTAIGLCVGGNYLKTFI
jgi:hypothetical protein